jgi:curli biogenesis system outer membrane secretion channel CsgG
MIPLCSTALAQNTAPKRRIAVMNFDYRAANPDTLAALFGGEQDIGKGIAALLIAELVREGGYTVIEYAALDKVLAEQDLSNAERVDPWIASRAGRILGVDAILVGSITRFGPEQEPKNSSGKPGRFASLSGSSGAATKKSKAVVDLTVRVVDPMTGDLLASVIGTGISPEAGTFYYVNLRTKQGDFNFSSSQFAGTVLGQATRNAVDQTAAQLLALVDKIPFAKRAISGRIADVSGNELTLNVGSRDGLKMGDTLTVRHQIRVIVIPLPGAGIRDIAEVVGTATVTALDAGSAIATFSGNGPPAIGDAVETHP